MTVKVKLITPSQWDALPPKAEPELVGKSARIIFHHTAGHGKGPSRDDAMQYARLIQRDHMMPGGLGVKDGGNDSGHNFLVMRSGLILVGRWFTVTAIQHGLMVRSAHCRGQNEQIGIEHEHLGDEKMTAPQRRSSARLQAWIADRYGRKVVLPAAPHNSFSATACPANLIDEIEPIRKLAQAILAAEGGPNVC